MMKLIILIAGIAFVIGYAIFCIRSVDQLVAMENEMSKNVEVTEKTISNLKENHIETEKQLEKTNSQKSELEKEKEQLSEERSKLEQELGVSNE